MFVRSTCPSSVAARLLPLLCPSHNPSIDPTMASTPKGTPIPTPYFVVPSNLEAETGNEIEIDPEVSPAEHTNVEPLFYQSRAPSGITVVVTGVIGDAQMIELLVDEDLLVDDVLLVVGLQTDVEAAVPNGTSVEASLKPWL
jgi:hypothetical protein